MENKYFYTTEVEWTGERRGDLRAPVMPNLKIDAPPEFKGHDGVWTPEHLFVAALNPQTKEIPPLPLDLPENRID